MGIHSEAFECVRRLFCKCVLELLKVSADDQGISNEEESQFSADNQGSSNEKEGQPLSPSPRMIEYSATRFLFRDFSGAHTYYATKEADLNTENDSQVDACDSDYCEPSDSEEESDDDYSDDEKDCEDEKCVGGYLKLACSLSMQRTTWKKKIWNV